MEPLVYSRHCSRHKVLGSEQNKICALKEFIFYQSTQTTSQRKMLLVVRSAWKDEAVCKIDRIRADKLFQRSSLAG